MALVIIFAQLLRYVSRIKVPECFPVPNDTMNCSPVSFLAVLTAPEYNICVNSSYQDSPASLLGTVDSM